MAKEEKEDVEEKEKEPKKNPIAKIAIITVVIVIVVAAGIFGALFFLKGKDSGNREAKAQVNRPVIGALWPMDPFIVNLLDNQGERYLKVVMQLELSDETAVHELEQLKPKLRDNVLDLLTAKTYNELMDLSGKQRLREEIAMRLNSYLVKGKIVRVYFTEFVIQ